ncbi:Adapter molecule Crk [Nymphon striatum]|nr:Adapter molecule Crk [Nymphon striatum]
MTKEVDAVNVKGPRLIVRQFAKDHILSVGGLYYFFGPMSRQDATDVLMAEKESGVFLVRESASMTGDLVLCVREDSKVSHYIINILSGDGPHKRYRIGEQIFPDVPSLLTFYRLHYLDTTPLIRPAPRRIERVRAKYDFDGSDPDDLPFKKGEVLTVVSKDEDQWWTARNSIGQTGSIPVPYIEQVTELEVNSQLNDSPSIRPVIESISNNSSQNIAPIIQRVLPANARVKQPRVPCAYDQTALKLEYAKHYALTNGKLHFFIPETMPSAVGICAIVTIKYELKKLNKDKFLQDIVKVTKMNINGQWEGEIDGRVGHFPFTHVEFIDSDNPDDDEA